MPPAKKASKAVKKAPKKKTAPVEEATSEAPVFPPVEETKAPDLEKKADPERKTPPPRPYFQV